MLHTNENQPGKQRRINVRWLTAPLLFTPVLLIQSSPLTAASVSVFLLVFAICAVLAYVNWTICPARSSISGTPNRAKGHRISTRSTVLLSVVMLLFPGALVSATDWSTYRGFRFGTSLVITANRIGAKPSEARVAHQRPAVIQELNWRPDTTWSATGARLDPLHDGVLRFYDGALFQIIANYDSERVQGMTQADIVKVLSQTYGPSTAPDVEIPFQSSYGDTARVLGRWESPEYVVDLVSSGYPSSYALVLSLKRLATLAQVAIAEASRLDELEAPQREIDARNQKEADNRLVLEKARSVNLPNFRP